ncbi:MAG: type II toxin-antitoxin system VapC family toxin [Dehalococcoidia bacterium]|nr:type II toxin-antitoxin system VapC family toxin [Dehalococcoidia bacterium]
MTLAYFDASALVKLFIDETGSEDVALLWDGADAVVTSRLAQTEVRVALAAAHRAQRLDDGAYLAAKGSWERYRAAVRMVEVTAELAEVAAEVAEAHSLTALDAVHLASAILFASTPLVVATWDARLLVATQSLGISTLPAHIEA